jgi:hypothetical protein
MRAARNGRRLSPRAAMAYSAALGIFMLAFSVHALWQGFYSLPSTYDTLEATGVPVELQVTRCGTGIHGDRGYECVVRLSYAGSTRDWTYPYEVSQFYPYTPGESVPGLVDPRHPSTAYTVFNVDDRAGAGLHSSNTAAGVFFAMFEIVSAAVFEHNRRRARRLGSAGVMR